MKTKDVPIEDYGKIVLKKLSYAEKCTLRGKILNIKVDNLGNQSQEVNSEAMFFWLVVYSIKSMPNYAEFYTLPEEKRASIVSYFGLGDNEPENLGEIIFEEAQEFNKFLGKTELKKKSD